MLNGDTVTVVIHVWRNSLAWYVKVHPPGRAPYIAARGVTDREPEPVLDTYGKAVMDAAYEAYRALGE